MGGSSAGPDAQPSFLVLDETEARLVSEVLSLLKARGSPEAGRVERRFDDLEILGRAVSRFPSVRESQKLGSVSWGPDTLEAALCSMSGTSRLLHTPTRVVAGRSFLVAKVHALSLASLSVSFDRGLAERLRDCILGVVFSLLAEDVYLSGLDDKEYSDEKRAALASDLVSLWDGRRDPRAVAHVPALAELWAVRDAQVPVFGTMEGASELTRLSLDLGHAWFAFVAERLHDAETLLALEEFLFGLSYEEILLVRSCMASRDFNCADAQQVRTLLGGKTSYAAVDGQDPRAMYEFYAERRNASRARAWAGIPGPRRTLEELYLSFLISKE
jgi:hypothetical protein